MFIKSIKGVLAPVLLLCFLGCGFSSAFGDHVADLAAAKDVETCRQKLDNAKQDFIGNPEGLKVILSMAKDAKRQALLTSLKNENITDPEEIARRLKADNVYDFLCQQSYDLDKQGVGGNQRNGQKITWGERFFNNLNDRTARSVSDVIDGRIRSTGDRLVVPAWEAIIDGILKVWQKSVSVLFHKSKDPFTKQELERWSNIVVNDLNGFGLLIKGREAFDSRSKDFTGRAFDSDVEVTVNQDQLLNELIIKRYAEQFENYALEIESRKGYYKNNREVVFIANQIIKWLLEFRQIILSIKSIKDVAAKFGQNITVITEMQKNIKNLFDELSRAVAPSSYLDSKKRTNYSDSQQRPNYPMSYGNNYGDPDWMSN